MAQSARSQRLSDVRLFKLEIGAAEPRSVTGIAPKSSFLCVNTIGLDQFCSKMPYSAGRMLALEIAYSARNSAGRIYPSLERFGLASMFSY